MKLRHFGFAVALSALVLTGCAANPAPHGEPDKAESNGSSNSVERWAGIVAEEATEYSAWRDHWEGSNCLPLIQEAPCTAQLVSASFLVRTTHLRISGPSDPAARTYIGTPPEEISDLYSETIAATSRASSAGQDYADCDGDCVDEAIALEREISALEKKFAGWSPYL